MFDALLQHLALALGLGLLVGFQREWTTAHLAGIRTFALVTVSGTLCGELSRIASPWILPAGLLGIVVMLGVGTFVYVKRRDPEPGVTTQVAAILMFLVGASLIYLPATIPVLVSGLTAVLLHWKEPLHGFVRQIGPRDIRAIIRLVLLALVILPIVPNQNFGPNGVLNPYEIWMMVVLVCGIGLASYIAYKFLGEQGGAVLSGLLGGLVSSTAATLSYARRSVQPGSNATLGALAILIASTVVFLRVFIEVMVAAPGLLPQIILPLAAMMGWMALLSCGLYLGRPREVQAAPFDDEPFHFRWAVAFAGFYALLLVVVAFARERFGNEMLYAVAAVAGLTEMDAITLSSARLMHTGQLEIDQGWRMILIGALSNIVFKMLIVVAVGSRELRSRVALVFTASLAVGIGILLFWPTLN